MRTLACFLVLLLGPVALQAANITQPYVMAFEACDHAVTICSGGSNDKIYLAQSMDGANWSVVPGLSGWPGIKPSLTQRGNELYIYTSSGSLYRYHLDTDAVDGPLSVTAGNVSLNGNPGHVAANTRSDGSIVIFYNDLSAHSSSEFCQQTSCAERVLSASEISGSDGQRFTVDAGDRLDVASSSSGPLHSAWVGNVFQDASQYVMYVEDEFGTGSIAAYTSSSLQGSFQAPASVPSAILQYSPGPLFSDGYFDPISQTYWIYITQLASNGASIGRSVFGSLDTAQNATGGMVVTGSSIGLTATTNLVNVAVIALAGVPVRSTSMNYAFNGSSGISRTASADPATITVGYAMLTPTSSSIAPPGFAIFGFEQNGILVTEASVKAVTPASSGRIYAAVEGIGQNQEDTGIAIANPNSTPVTLSFYFTDQNGNQFGQGSTVLQANQQISSFLDQPPYNAVAPIHGTFTFSASEPVAAVALRGYTNERSEFLITTLPVTSPTATPPSPPYRLAHFADGGGWSTQVVLVNVTDNPISGQITFYGQGTASTAAVPVAISAAGAATLASVYSYTIPADSSWRLQTAGTALSVQAGSVSVVPSAGSVNPVAFGIFSYRNNGVTVTEASVGASMPAQQTQQLYVESGASIETGIAIANSSPNPVSATLTAYDISGAPTGLNATVQLPANGQTAMFLNQIPGFQTLPSTFRGTVQVASSAPSITMIGLRGRYNERGDFLITTTPVFSYPSASRPGQAFVFPDLAAGGGYTTQFILLPAGSNAGSSGTLQFFNQAGNSLALALAP